MKVVETETSVIIDRFEIYGFINEELCKICKTNLVYYDDYDANFCPKCNHWTENKCSDNDCGYCANRTAKPLSNK